MQSNHCPICEEENSCMAGTVEQDNCWCVNSKFPEKLFELVPEESKGKHCICQKCLNNSREVDNT